ncbi:hypothetical protein Tsubulata_018916 [Turnera subulata]|uniref:AP2/ERF domain-containing protein n=1 Tax=Turnera subulata TaxID=218843 RepID=A0A9Q0FL88_9ROSI|nr:hypothetical protein Tsubulata_018916 [Turnera subulata]
MDATEKLSSTSPSALATSAKTLHVCMQKLKAGRKKFQETRHPTHRGVRRRNGKWVCEVRQPHDKTGRIWLGTFTCPEMAARAHDAAALALRGEAAVLNFPGTAHLLPQARSTSIKDIQCAADSVGCVSLFDLGCHDWSSTSFSYSCLSCGTESKEKNGGNFLDEEELFNMPGLLDSMAEGLILTPPGISTGFSWDDDEENAVDLNLWVY